MTAPRSAPMPQTQRLVGHLGRWGRAPLPLLEEGAASGPVFRLKLWRDALVGYSPEWNRFILGDTDTFRSRGSMSGLSPHLAAGVVHTDGPAHGERRRELNPAFARTPIAALQPVVAEVVERNLPRGEFDAVSWSAALLRQILSAAFFGDVLSPELLAAFLKPLDLRLPGPFLPRPVLFARMNRALRQTLPNVPADRLGAAFSGLDGGLAETRVAISAGYDTTAHTLAWLLHHAASQPLMFEAEHRAAAIDETLRLYPAGWLGSRRCSIATSFGGIEIPRGTLVMYSPYLTHRDPTLWKDPLLFRPERFRDPLPAWGFIPFAAGKRSCLGSWFARMVLSTVLAAFADSTLTATGGDPRPRAGITLAPSQPLMLHRRP